MSLNSDELVRIIKQAAVEAVIAKDPMAFKIGEVISASPLKISINQKITIPASQIYLTNAVRDSVVYMTVDHATGSALGSVDLSHSHTYSGTTESEGEAYSGTTSVTGGENLSHTHSYSGKKKYTVHLALKAGEKVLMLRCDGGQKFIVIDRLEAPK